ncbi:MAG: hypothetical protein P8Z42_16810, partial [Anaerolineales bacterium]
LLHLDRRPLGDDVDGVTVVGHHRLRSVLTTLGILIGVVVVTVIISVIQGLNTYVSGELSSLYVTEKSHS